MASEQSNETVPVSVTISASAAHDLALACNRAANMLGDRMEEANEPLDERDRAMFDRLDWARRELFSIPVDWRNRDV